MAAPETHMTRRVRDNPVALARLTDLWRRIEDE